MAPLPAANLTTKSARDPKNAINRRQMRTL
jgi:hypothetical protein